MTPWWVVLLLFGDGPIPQDCHVYSPVLQRCAIALELIDRREHRHILVDSDLFQNDMAMLRRRAMDLRDVPFIIEANRLPPRWLALAYMTWNRDVYKMVELRAVSELHHASHHRQMMLELDKLYAIWDAVADAQSEYFYVHLKRMALRQIIDHAGYDAFYSGNLPYPVPLVAK